MHPVITSADQVTPGWLTRILAKQGALDQRGPVSVQTVTCLKRTSTWFADIAFLKVGYSAQAAALPGRIRRWGRHCFHRWFADKKPILWPKSWQKRTVLDPDAAITDAVAPNSKWTPLPRRLFLKLSRPGLTPADLAWGKQEVVFYNAIASAADDMPLARCYDAVYEPATHRSHILLDDLSQTHDQPPLPLPPCRADCERAMDALAKIHAYWWEHPRLRTDIKALCGAETPRAEHAGLPHSLGETEAMFPVFADFMGDRLGAARRSLYEKVFASWPFSGLSDRLDRGQGTTLIHGDAHAWNFFFPRDPERDRTCIVDWQEWRIDLGTHDLAEMIVLWWYPARRARMEEALVRRYHRQLLAHGVQDYDWQQCWDDYRLSAIRILLYPVWMHAQGRSPTYWWSVLEKAASAFCDLGCADLLV